MAAGIILSCYNFDQCVPARLFFFSSAFHACFWFSIKFRFQQLDHVNVVSSGVWRTIVRRVIGRRQSIFWTRKNSVSTASNMSRVECGETYCASILGLIEALKRQKSGESSKSADSAHPPGQSQRNARFIPTQCHICN